MSANLVTLKQSRLVRKMANAKGVSSEQFERALNDGSFDRFLDSLKVDGQPPEPPEGARIRVIRGVKVVQDREWQAAVNAAGTNTPKNDNVRKVGDQYAPAGFGEVDEELILLNFPKGDGTWDKALAWAEAKGLKRTNPREVFALGEHHPNLHQEFGQNPMYVAATAPCTLGGGPRACCIWWGGSRHGVSLSWITGFYGADGWFAFRR